METPLVEGYLHSSPRSPRCFSTSTTTKLSRPNINSSSTCLNQQPTTRHEVLSHSLASRTSIRQLTYTTQLSGIKCSRRLFGSCREKRRKCVCESIYFLHPFPCFSFPSPNPRSKHGLMGALCIEECIAGKGGDDCSLCQCLCYYFHSGYVFLG